jgi:hypothetical protein
LNLNGSAVIVDERILGFDFAFAMRAWPHSLSRRRSAQRKDDYKDGGTPCGAISAPPMLLLLLRPAAAFNKDMSINIHTTHE